MKRLREGAARFDRFLAMRWPGLHVTRVHWIALASVPMLIVAGLYWLGAAPLPADLVDPSDVFAILMIVLGCMAASWLVFRGLGYRLLPVARGLSRAHWIWLDLASVLFILLPAVAIPAALETRYRAARAMPELAADMLALAPGLQDHGFGRPMALLSRLSGQEMWNVDETNRCTLSTEAVAVLCKYGPSRWLERDGSGTVSVLRVRDCLENFETYWAAHDSRFRADVDTQMALLFVLAVLLGLVLLVNSLPAVEVGGLLCCLGWVGGACAILAVAAVMDAGETAMSGLVGAFMLLALLVTLVLALRRKSSLTLRASTSMCALMFPILATTFLVEGLGSSRMTDWGYENARLVGWLALAVLSMAAPLWQWWVNRLHACPE